MSKNWLLPDRGQQMLLPPSIDELLPENHLARFVAEVAERLDLSPIIAKYEPRGRGSDAFHPSLLVALIFYGYATGTMSSRKIERACHFDIAFRFLAGGHRPDHTTISEFRRQHLGELSALFVRILVLAREMGFLKVGAVAIDGTKIKANASKHAAVSYKRAKEIERQLREEVARLMKMAEEADNAPTAEGIDIPAEIARREERIAKLAAAQRAIEQRHAEHTAAEYEEALAETLAKTREAAEKAAKGEPFDPPPPPPAPPCAEPPAAMQHNFTDADSRIMPDKGGFSQAYNTQVSVDTESMLIVGSHTTRSTNDKRELLAAISMIADAYGKPESVLADAGYFNAAAIAKCPADAYIAPGRLSHNRPLDALLAKPAEAMRHKLATAAGRALYRLRKMTVEPALGIIKQALGFRQFHLRGSEKTQGEWSLVCIGYNLKRLWNMSTPA